MRTPHSNAGLGITKGLTCMNWGAVEVPRHVRDKFTLIASLARMPSEPAKHLILFITRTNEEIPIHSYVY